MARPESTIKEKDLKFEGPGPCKTGSVEFEPRADIFLISEVELSRKVSFRLGHPDDDVYGTTQILQDREEVASGVSHLIKGYERNGERMGARQERLYPKAVWGLDKMPERKQTKKESLEVEDNGAIVALERVHFESVSDEVEEDGSPKWVNDTYFVAWINGEVYWIDGSVGEDFGGTQKDILDIPRPERNRLAKLFRPLEIPEEDPRDLE